MDRIKLEKGRWCQLSYDLRKHLTRSEADVLGFLISEHNSRQAKEFTRGYFKCSTKRIIEALSISEKTVERSLRKLSQERRFIRIWRRGRLGWRWVRLRPVKMTGYDPSKRRMLDTTNVVSQEEHCRTARQCDGSYKNNKEKEMPFLELGHQYNPEPIKQPSLFDRDCATRLIKAIAKHLKKFKNKTKKKMYRTQMWAKHFTRMRKIDGIEKDRITKAVSWYESNIGKEYVPLVFSATTFRRKFPNLEEAMSRDKDNTDIEISEDAKRIAERLRLKGWPKGSDKQLPQVVQKSLDNYQAYLKSLRSYRNKLRERFGTEDPFSAKMNGTPRNLKDLFRLVTHLCDAFPSPIGFVDEWFVTIHHDVSNWEEWKGNLKGFIIKTNSERFRSYAYDLTSNYCGETTRYDLLLEKLQ